MSNDFEQPLMHIISKERTNNGTKMSQESLAIDVFASESPIGFITPNYGNTNISPRNQD
jgi:hypothetical protein